MIFASIGGQILQGKCNFNFTLYLTNFKQYGLRKSPTVILSMFFTNSRPRKMSIESPCQSKNPIQQNAKADAMCCWDGSDSMIINQARYCYK